MKISIKNRRIHNKSRILLLMKQRFVWIINMLNCNFNFSQLMFAINFLKEKILHSNRYYNHHDLHFSIEIDIQSVSYELRSRISNHIEFVIVSQQLIIITLIRKHHRKHHRKFNSIRFTFKNLRNLYRQFFSSLYVNAWSNNTMFDLKKCFWHDSVFLYQFEINFVKRTRWLSRNSKSIKYRNKRKISINISKF